MDDINYEIKDIVDQNFDPDLGPISEDSEVITPNNDPEVFSESFMGIDCTKEEKYTGIGTGITCGVATGIGISYMMVKNHKTIMDGIKIAGKIIGTFIDVL